MWNKPRNKDLHRGPWVPEDVTHIESVVRLKIPTSVLYLYPYLHVHPHGSDDKDTLDSACSNFRNSDIPVTYVDPSKDGCTLEFPSIGLFVYYTRDAKFMSRMPTFFHQAILHDILRSRSAIVDITRGSPFRSSGNAAVNARGRFGFIRSQDKGCSFSVSKDTHVFQSESIKGIVEVGTIAQEAVSSNHPTAFHDELRTKLVSETMCKLMCVPLRKWHWEYIDVIVSSGAKVIRHCDYVSFVISIV